MSETRDIVKEGVTVGTLTLPDNTPEDVWTERLAAHTYTPSQTLQEIAKAQILARMAFGTDFMATYGARNALAGLTNVQVDTISERLAATQRLLLAGALETALMKIEALIPDALIPQDVTDEFKAKIKAYLALP